MLFIGFRYNFGLPKIYMMSVQDQIVHGDALTLRFDRPCNRAPLA